MDAARIAVLLDPFLGSPGDRRLATDELDQILTYINLLLRWNARINLTAVRNPEEIVPRHFGESFFMARHLFPPSNARLSDRTKAGGESSSRAQLVLDLGSGAGFPGLPLKIWAPGIHLTLIESNHKKVAFLREVIRALTLTNVNVIPERAETLAARLRLDRIEPEIPLVPRPDPADPQCLANQSFAENAVVEERVVGQHRVEPVPSLRSVPFGPDVVTFRAVERFRQILALALRLLPPRSRLAILVDAAQLAELRAIPNMQWAISSVPESRSRVLSIGAVGIEK